MRDEIGKRMKGYEEVAKGRLVRRMPVIIRIDGKAHHTFTRGFRKPFDEFYIQCMQYTMKYLCENIQGCVLGYTQSDEITLVLVDYKKIESSSWFDNEIQKMCSVSASMTTMAFNKYFAGNLELMMDAKQEIQRERIGRFGFGNEEETEKEFYDVVDNYIASIAKGAMFDSRCFNIPKEEVTNCIYWRQLDAVRNSIQMVGQANFSHKELQNKNCSQIQDMLLTQKGIKWNDLPTYQRRGSCCVKTEKEKVVNGETVMCSEWIIDKEIPTFKGDGREYVESRLYLN